MRAFPVIALLLMPGAIAAQTLRQAAPADVGMSAEALDRLAATLDGEAAGGRLPGGVVLVARDGRVVLEHAFGMRDREAGDAMQGDAIFRIASQTKALVSVGIMMLQEQGDLVITDALGKYLPEFAHTTVAVSLDEGGYDVVDAARPITIRDLLTHTAGIGYGNGVAADRWEAAGIQGWYFAHRTEPIRETVRRMAALPFDAQPGAAYVYGYSTDILGALIEVVSGQPLDVFLRERITGPLGMDDTQFYLDPAQRDRLTVVYSRREDGSLTRTPDVSAMVGQGAYVEGPRRSFSGGAGLLSTARDYARLLQMLLNGGELDGVRLLSPKTVELMTADHVDERYPWAAGTGFGLGFSVLEDLGARGMPGSVGEFGWGGAYHSSYWVDPVERLVVVYLTQIIPATGLNDFDRVRAGVYSAVVDAGGRGLRAGVRDQDRP
jgi:CubicO group peptidase (beta-lactamase class C family)